MDPCPKQTSWPGAAVLRQGPRHGRKPPSWLHQCQGRRGDAFTSNNPASVSTRLAGAPGNTELQHRCPESQPRAKKRPKPLELSTPTRGSGTQGARHPGSWAHEPRLRPSKGFCQGWEGSFCALWLSPLSVAGILVLRQPGVPGTGSAFSSLPITGGASCKLKIHQSSLEKNMTKQAKAVGRASCLRTVPAPARGKDPQPRLAGRPQVTARYRSKLSVCGCCWCSHV